MAGYSGFLMLFVPASLAINFYPGPNNLFALANAANFGVKESLRASLGRQLAFAMLVVALAAGLGALFVASPTVFLVLKIAGAAFLVWLGIKMLLRPPDLPEAASLLDDGERKRMLRDEFMVAFANPKPVIVLLPFLPQLVAPGATASFGIAAAGVLFLVLEGAAALAYAVAGIRLTEFAQRPEGRLWLNRAGAAAVIASALLILLTGPSHQ